MPDPTKKTVSASQIAALYDQSPYITRYMLWQSFANSIDIERDEHARMSWGLLMQPLILAEAAKDLRLEITPNESDDYVTRGSLGCTRDAEIADQKGNVVVEVKCAFDWNIWYSEWAGGKQPPPHVELQLQAQMAVGDGKAAYPRGVIVAWVGAELHYFWRDLDGDLAEDMMVRAADFLKSVANGDEPDAFGDEKELPIIAARWPKIERTKQELDDHDMAETAVMYGHAKEQESFWKKSAGKYKAKLLDTCEDYASTYLPEGVIVNVGKSETPAKIITDDDVGKVARKASIRTTIKITQLEGAAPAAPAETPLDAG